MSKKFWSVVIVILVLIIIAAVVGVTFLDKIVKTGIETAGPKITGVTVQVDDVHISLLAGTAQIKELVIGNPDGYKSPSAINIGTAAVGLNPASILTDKVVVRSIRVEAPEITFEGGLGGNNLSKILDNANGPAPKTGLILTNSPVPPQPGKKIEVDDLLITGAKVHAIVTDVGGKEMTLTLPEIHLTNLGKDGNGLTPAELTRVVLKAIVSSTVKAVTGELTDLNGKGAELLKDNNTVNKIKSSVGGLFNK